MEELPGFKEVKPTGPHVRLIGGEAIRTIKIDPTATVESGTDIHKGVIIEPGVIVGQSVTLAPGAHIGYGSTLDNGSIVQPDVYVKPYSQIRAGETVRP